MRKVVSPLFLLLFTFLVNCPAWSDTLPEQCVKSGDHESVLFLLVDRSDELAKTDSLEQSLRALEQMLQPGERLVVGMSTDKVSDTRIVLDKVKPKPSIWVSKLKVRAQEKEFSECFEKMKRLVLTQNESYKHSAIIETLSFVSKVVSADKSSSKRVVLFSDMIQNSPEISFYRVNSVDPTALLKQIEKKFMMWDFPKVEIFAAGAGVGVTDQKARSIEAFWKQYFAKMGASLKFYGPVLIGS